MDAMTFLERVAEATPRPLYVLHGDEPFLKRQVQVALRTLLLGPKDDGFALSSYPGDKATLATILDDLRTLPFLSPHRLVVIESADPFVTQERTKLEKVVAELVEKKKAGTGVLVLEMRTWTATTKLAKMVPESMTISCKSPASHLLPDWCANWCRTHHGKQLASAAARLLVDLIGPEMGLLDQEMEKLAIFVGEAPRIETKDVDTLVGRSRGEKTFEIFKLITAGKASEAVAFLDRLLEQGEEPIALLGAFSWQLRRVAQVGRLVVQGMPMTSALEQMGGEAYARTRDEQLMRHLGRRRLDQIYEWLLQADLGLKGSSALPPRTLLERLVVQLARPRT